MDTKKLDRLNRGRTMRLALPAFLAMLDDDLQGIIGQIVSDFNSGEKDFVRHAARITTLVNLKDDLLAQAAETEQLEGEIHGQR